MERRKFIKACGISALGVSSLPLLNACKTGEIHTSSTSLLNENNEIVVKKSAFTADKKYVFITHPAIEYPICLFQTGTDEYAASLMSCTHQRCKTTVKEDYYICPCHGSRFSNTGKVIRGPADKDLATYQLRITQSTIFISV